jgi:hypothetical protein
LGTVERMNSPAGVRLEKIVNGCCMTEYAVYERAESHSVHPEGGPNDMRDRIERRFKRKFEKGPEN